jgi:hypothetical protein
MVDFRGTILSIQMDSSLIPETLQVLSIPHLIEARQGYFSGAELDSAMVTFLSSSVLVMGLAPNLLAVNVDSANLEIWSQQQTLAEMNSQSIFSKASDLLLGRTDDDNNAVDMPPASAICQAGGEYVFSLHSDASIRRWRLVHELYPTEVLTLKVDALASPQTWSDSSGAVSLAAQLYQSVYALAISIQTVAIDESKSPCQLTVIDGSQDEQEEGDLVRSVLNLTVPKTAKSLVGLDLASERCSLTALFQSNENDLDSTLLVTYPPSVVSIVSSEPIVTPHANTLDGVASSERARITNLSFSVSNGTCLEEDLHSVDAAFLKYLFRPAFPRGGTGAVTRPSCVRSAIRKLVPGHYSTTAEQKMSIELETLRAMHDWRRIDSRRVPSPVPRETNSTAVPATPGGTTVYDAYARHDQDGTPDMNMDESDVEGEEDLLDQEREAQVESHEQRWRELLLAVWNEEERLLEALHVSSLQSVGPANFALVRAGVTSLLKEVELGSDAANKWEDLDRAAMSLLERIENSHDGLSKLNSIQSRVFEEIAKISFVISTVSIGTIEQELTNIGKELIKSDDCHFNAEGIAAIVCESSQDDTLDWLQSVDSLFSLGLPGASVLPDSAEVLDDDEDKSWSNRVAGVQTRLAASSLFVQCSDSVRRLSLARFLLVSNLNGEDFSSADSPICQAAFRAYLFSLSVLWSCTQHVTMPSTGLLGRNRNIEFGRMNIESASPSDSPPTKRISFGDITSSILAEEGRGHSNMTTMLDARFIQISQEHSQTLYETGSPDGSVVTMVRICMNSTFSAAPSDTLPELGVLPTPSDESVASDYPRIALRLIAPFYAFASFNEDQDTKLARKEALAECLLIEANAESQKGPSFDSLVNTLQLKACDLLAPLSSDARTAVDHNLLETVFLTLSKQSQDMPVPSDLDEIDENKMALANEFQLLLTGSPGRPGAEIIRLCRQPTVISVFLPLMATENKSFFRSLEELSHASVKSMTEVLLRISQLIYRLSILERHSGGLAGLGRNESSGKNDFLLGYIEQAISEFQSLLPSSVYVSMAEYATLWTLLFNHSVTSRRWTMAHTVCVSHPVPERRIENYKRLVIAMLNAGAVSDLMDLCSMVTCSGETMDTLGDKGACIDFYEIVVETLSQVRQGYPYENGSVSTDFLGCLYALHVSRGHWDRAAQAMDAKYTLALNAISSSVGLAERTASIVNVTAAADDLVLSSISASNALQSINDPSKRFLVSGEVGPYPSLPFTAKPEETIETEEATNKRDRNGLDWKSPRRIDPARTRDGDAESRLSRFMTVADLNARAARAVALWIFLREKTGDVSSIPLESFKSPSTEGDRTCIDRLASLGYYDHAILVAKVIDKQYEERSYGAKPGGHSVLQDYIMQVLSHVLPVALGQRNMRPSNDEMGTGEAPERPTLLQLRRAIEEAGHVSTSPFSYVLGETWFPQSELPAKATASGAMHFARKLTTEFSSASSPIALEAASMILDIDPSGVSLPLWLERLLLGVQDKSAGAKPGLFAHHACSSSGIYSGDPSGLVSLYMKRGLYSKACSIVSALLTGMNDGNDDKSREMRAPARLPEKGDIDFVPYAKIDTLWGLIDHVLSNPATTESEKKELEESRKAMERALEKHFQLMKISEQGMQSARALTK